MNKYKLAMDKVKFDENFEEKTLSAMRKNKGNAFKWITAGAGIAAAVLIMVFALPALQLDTQGVLPNNPAESTSPSAKPTQSATLQKVVYSDYESDSIDESVPNSGDVNIGYGLLQAIESPENEGALFFVKIQLFFNHEKYFSHNGKTLDEIRKVSILEKFNSDYDIWYSTIYPDLDNQMKLAEKNGDKSAIGWEKHDVGVLFLEYWSKKQSEQDLEAYSAAKNDLMIANNAFSEWFESQEYDNVINDIYRNECARLVTLGIDVEVSGNRLIGKLSKSNIQTFPASFDYGYQISFGNGDDIIDE